MATLFLRRSNITLVDIEIISDNDTVKDLHPVVIIKEYSKFLIDNIDQKDEIISYFDDLSELRGWFFERYLPATKTPTLPKVINAIGANYFGLVSRLSLEWVVD